MYAGRTPHREQLIWLGINMCCMLKLEAWGGGGGLERVQTTYDKEGEGKGFKR